MAIELTFLGTGTSQGIPMIACDCPVCSSDDPRDRRHRTSALLTVDGRNVLIDAAPELRLQALRAGITDLHAVLITHAHADHIFGLDDLRRFNQVHHKPLPVYAAPADLAIIENVFGYARAQEANPNRDLPQLIFRPITEPIPVGDACIAPLPLRHGDGSSLGFRVGPLAYCTDLSEMPTETLAQLQDLDTLVLGALRPRPHPKHLSFEQALALVNEIHPRRTFFVHLSHDVLHAQEDRHLPPHVRLAYDGLRITVPR